jgi:hypothetical protein
MAIDPGIAAWLRQKKSSAVSPLDYAQPASQPLTHNEEATGGTQYVARTDPLAAAPAATPTAPGVSRAVGNVNAAPSQDDLYAAIYGDPGYQAAKAGADRSLASAAAARRAALRQLVLSYGGIGGLTDTYGDIDQATLDAAAANPYSDIARAKGSYNTGVEAFRRSLAARGALQSGDLGYGQGRLDYQRGQAEYDLANQFSTGAGNAVNAYAGAEGDYYSRLAQAIRDAAQTVAQWWTPRDGNYDEAGQLNTDLGTSLPTEPPPGTQVAGTIGGTSVYRYPSVPGADTPGFVYGASGQPILEHPPFDSSAPAISNPDVVWYRDPNTGELYSRPRGRVAPGVGAA